MTQGLNRNDSLPENASQADSNNIHVTLCIMACLCGSELANILKQRLQDRRRCEMTVL